MKCPKCDTELLYNDKKCPNCGTLIVRDDDLDIELPSMKKEVEETYSNVEPTINTDKVGEISFDFQDETPEEIIEEKPKDLKELINKSNDNVDKMNEEMEKILADDDEEDEEPAPVAEAPAPEPTPEEATGAKVKEDIEVEAPEVNNILKYEAILPDKEEKETLKIKKNYLLVCGFIGLLIILALVFGLKYLRNHNTKYDFKGELSASLNKYYASDGKDYTDLNKVLDHIYKEQSKLETAREEVNNRVNEWLREYINVDANNASEFAEATTKYKTLVDNLHDKVAVNNVRLLDDDKYKEFTTRLDSINKDSKQFYKGLEFFNNKEYNNAYEVFSEIDEANVYYEQAKEFKTKISNTVISFIKKDIVTLEVGLETKSEEEKLQTYKQIEDIIIKYAKTYNKLNLQDNETYKEYLNAYHNKVNNL